MHHYFLCCEPFLVKNTTFLWHFHGHHLWHGFGKVSWSQIFPWNRSWFNKNRFHEKEEGQFLHTNGIYCVLLAINSSKHHFFTLFLMLVWWQKSRCVSYLLSCHQTSIKNKVNCGYLPSWWKKESSLVSVVNKSQYCDTHRRHHR